MNGSSNKSKHINKQTNNVHVFLAMEVFKNLKNSNIHRL